MYKRNGKTELFTLKVIMLVIIINPSTLHRDKKRSELRRAQLAGPPDDDGALCDVQENEIADQHGIPPDPSDLAARTKTAESKNKRKNRKRGGKASATSNSSELQVDRAGLEIYLIFS